MESGSSNQRIAKNTVLLYLRTALVLVISLYTSRLVLKALGADDLGIYNVVGGIVALMVSFRAALSKATSRYITFELGKGDNNPYLSRIFSAAMTNHLIIGSIAFVLGETIGLLIFNNWTDIPESRQQAAFWVYQCALMIFFINTIVSPYESVVIAHEKMTVYAYISILMAILKLLIAFIMLNTDLDRLKIYGFLMLSIDVLVFFIYNIYNRKKYPYIKFHVLWDKDVSRNMFSFSGWTLLGSSSNAITQQGVSLLFNNFIGLVANAALGLATQVNGAVQQFVGSFQTAFNPQVIKLYAQQDLSQMHLLISRASKFSFLLAYILALPLIFNMDYVLNIWLTEVPQYTVIFCQLILISCIFDSTTGVFNTAITATGNIKGFQIGISLSFFLDLIVCAVLLILKFHPALVFGSRILTRGIINMLIELFYVQKLISFNIRRYLITVILPISITVLVTIPLLYFIKEYLSGWLYLLFSCATSLFACTIIGYSFYLSREEKKQLIHIIECKIKNR